MDMSEVKFIQHEEIAEDVKEISDKIIDLIDSLDLKRVDLVLNSFCFASLDVLVNSNVSPDKYKSFVDAMHSSMIWNLKDKGFIE